MQPTASSIPARSERQAMDWSLVLASQGIETIIDLDPAAGAWRLLVAPPDYARARQAIQQYLRENKARRWQHELPFSDLILDWRSVVPMLLFILLYAIEITGHAALQAAGILDNQAVARGEWWRLFTAITLHGDVNHLAANTTTGLLLVGLAMGAFGPGLGLLAPFLAGVLGNTAGLLIYGPDHRSLGASGMILGALGLLAAQSLILFQRGLAPRFLAVRSLIAGCLLLVLLGLGPGEKVDLVAHVGGFGAGLMFGALLAWAPRRWVESSWLTRGSLAAVAACVGIPWWLALRATPV